MEPDDALDDILDAWQEAFDRGTDLPPAELCRDRPDLLPEVERRVAVLRRGLGLFRPSDTQSFADHDTTTRLPTQLGDYRVVGRLGAGGMGEVYRAADVKLGREVAVKVMRPVLAADPQARGRFLREARVAAAVQHDHVVPIHHVGEQDGAPFIVMPLLEGESLEARLQRGPLPPAEVIRVGLEAALGLAAAHAKGLVHRDVKPGNLWLEAPAGRVKVLDFGLARAADGADGVTRSGAVVGSAPYMAPEQADGKEVDARADLFALGAVLYEAATGQRAFVGTTLTAILRAVAEQHPPPPHDINSIIPAPLSDLIMRLLAKNPNDRTHSALAVADGLNTVGQRGPLETGGPAATHRRVRRPLWPITALAVATLTGIGVVIWQATRHPGPEGEPKGTDDQPLSQSAKPTKPIRYRGSVDLLVHRKDDTGSDRLFPLADPRAMPLRPGDHVKLVAEVDPPAFLYVFWIDETGKAVPAYPWRFGEWGTRPAAEELVAGQNITYPGDLLLKIEGPNAGTETVLMLVRPTPLEATDAELQRRFADLKPVPFQGDKARVWFENFDVLRDDRLRAPGMVKLDAADGPRGLQAELRRRVGDIAGFSRAVSFSRKGAE